MELKHVQLERVNLFTAGYGTYEICSPGRLVIFKVLKKNQGRFPEQILQYFLQAARRHSSEMIQALYFSHLSISCLGNKQENLKKCLTGIALSSGEDSCQECGWMRMSKDLMVDD